ncbi:MAG TPA: hypothetical protein VI278_18450 [Nitrososphaeraceae archaeon]
MFYDPLDPALGNRRSGNNVFLKRLPAKIGCNSGPYSLAIIPAMKKWGFK